MLREIENVRQAEGEPHRRFFQGNDLELTVWYDSPARGRVTGFQLCYGTDHAQEHALTWLEGQKASHTAVNNIEGRFYAASTLKVNGEVNLSLLKERYGAQLASLEPALRACLDQVFENLASQGYSTRPIFSGTRLG